MVLAVVVIYREEIAAFASRNSIVLVLFFVVGFFQFANLFTSSDRFRVIAQSSLFVCSDLLQ